MLRKGVMPIPPAINTAGREGSGSSVKSPNGPVTLTSVPIGIAPRTRFIAVLRIRVANIRFGSQGALAIEKDRDVPSSSDSGGSIRARLTYWPGLKLNSLGFSK